MSNQRQTAISCLDITGSDRQLAYRQPTDYDKYSPTPKMSAERQRLVAILVKYRINNEAETQLPEYDMLSRDRCEIVPELVSLPRTWLAIQPKYLTLFEDTFLYKMLIRRYRRYHPYKLPREYFCRHRQHDVPCYHDYRYSSSAVCKHLEMTNEIHVDDHMIHHVWMAVIPELEIKTSVDWSLVDWGINRVTDCDHTKMREPGTDRETSLTDNCSTTQSHILTDAHNFPITDSWCPESVSLNTHINVKGECEVTTVETSLIQEPTTTTTVYSHPVSVTVRDILRECDDGQPEIETDKEDTLLADPDETGQSDIDLSLSESSIDLILGNSDKEIKPQKKIVLENSDVYIDKKDEENTTLGSDEKQAEEIDHSLDVETHAVDVEKPAAHITINLNTHKLDSHTEKSDVLTNSDKENTEMSPENNDSVEQSVQRSEATYGETDDKGVTSLSGLDITTVMEEIDSALADSLKSTSEICQLKLPSVEQKQALAYPSVADDLNVLLEIDSRHADEVVNQDDDYVAAIKKKADNTLVLSDIAVTSANHDPTTRQYSSKSVKKFTDRRPEEDSSTLPSVSEHRRKCTAVRKQKHVINPPDGSDVDGSTMVTKRPRVMYINPAMVSRYEAMVGHHIQQINTADVKREPVTGTEKQVSSSRRVVCLSAENRLQSGTNTDPTGVPPGIRDVDVTISTPVRTVNKSPVTADSQRIIRSETEPGPIEDQRRVNVGIPELTKARYRPAWMSDVTASLSVPGTSTDTTVAPSTPRRVIRLNPNRKQVDISDDVDRRESMGLSRNIKGRNVEKTAARCVLLPTGTSATPDSSKSTCISTQRVKIQFPDQNNSTDGLTSWGGISSKYSCPSQVTGTEMSQQDRLESRKRRFGSTLDQPTTKRSTQQAARLHGTYTTQHVTSCCEEGTSKRKFVLKKIQF